MQEARYAHLVGAARMGDNPANSVVDRFGRTHDPSYFPSQNGGPQSAPMRSERGCRC